MAPEQGSDDEQDGGFAPAGGAKKARKVSSGGTRGSQEQEPENEAGSPIQQAQKVAAPSTPEPVPVPAPAPAPAKATRVSPQSWTLVLSPENLADLELDPVETKYGTHYSLVYSDGRRFSLQTPPLLVRRMDLDGVGKPSDASASTPKDFKRRINVVTSLDPETCEKSTLPEETHECRDRVLASNPNLPHDHTAFRNRMELLLRRIGELLLLRAQREPRATPHTLVTQVLTALSVRKLTPEIQEQAVDTMLGLLKRSCWTYHGTFAGTRADEPPNSVFRFSERPVRQPRGGVKKETNSCIPLKTLMASSNDSIQGFALADPAGNVNGLLTEKESGELKAGGQPAEKEAGDPTKGEEEMSPDDSFEITPEQQKTVRHALLSDGWVWRGLRYIALDGSDPTPQAEKHNPFFSPIRQNDYVILSGTQVWITARNEWTVQLKLGDTIALVAAGDGPDVRDDEMFGGAQMAMPSSGKDEA